MPTTLIATSAGIGIGIMAQTMERNIDAIDSVVICDYPESICKTKLHFMKCISRFDLGNEKSIFPLLVNLQKDKNRKFLTIETSWNLSKFIDPDKNFYIPMWEQDSARLECQNSKNIISITKKTKNVVNSMGFNSAFLPYPIETMNMEFKQRKKVKKILHNAGSLGGNLRKGTPEAISMFQKSGLANNDIELHIHSWKEPPEEIQRMLSKDSMGIFWNNNFHDDYMKIYEDMDLLLFPSRLEGHAMVVLEAMAHGLPAIVSNVSPIDEYENDLDYKVPIASKCGNYSFVDCEAGASILQKICMSDISFKSIESHLFVKNNMSWDVFKKEYEELFS
jgi:glycosyltransferase involved in cell wall biosynthesis